MTILAHDIWESRTGRVTLEVTGEVDTRADFDTFAAYAESQSGTTSVVREGVHHDTVRSVFIFFVILTGTEAALKSSLTNIYAYDFDTGTGPSSGGGPTFGGGPGPG